MMTKTELSALMHSVCDTVCEGESAMDDVKKLPKIVYWEINWADDNASGEAYSTVVTYQVSFLSKTPRHPNLIALKHALNAKNIHPSIQHEYVKAEKGAGYFHSYLSVDVLEDL